MFKFVGNMLSKKAINFVEEKFADIKAKLDADGDGVPDFDEYPELIEDIKEAAQQALDGVNQGGVANGVQQILAGLADIKAAIQVDEVLEGAQKANKAVQELVKLGLAALQKLQPKTEVAEGG